VSSTDKSLAQALRTLESFAMPVCRDDAAIEAAGADDADAAPILSVPEPERRLAAGRAHDPFGVARSAARSACRSRASPAASACRSRPCGNGSKGAPPKRADARAAATDR
jgi:hypothetical protein